ncbi:MAG: arginine--tRNA ligase, partial [Clostridia bacterium]|nr:arginine--tRNA ligase [Clostridia bacterium]
MLFDKQLAQALANEQISAEEILGAFEVPKDSKMGDICLPCFKFSRALRKAPPQIATDLSKSLEGVEFIEKVDVVGGYLNIHLNRKAIAGALIDFLGKENIGGSDEGNGKTICLDYSSVNIAKPFHIGHLSTTVIGGALYRIFKHLGYDVVGINHLGDWGTQFGKLIVATRKWSSLEEIAANDEYFLNSLYVRYHQESESNPSL